ncbi:hemolysin family protein [Marispirochaeta sp.]|jgi:putative hemolysin|uniref:hemolysin family protein n=1 Tax=Marispirochaeta sp. TaxID=2038653 RepID=UPI0029C8A31E|nr:hemolysin family protein [Marispirochaeta sp.]
MLSSIIILVSLILLSGFFSATETAYTSLSSLQIQHLIERYGRRGRRVKELSGKPDILLTTILIGNNLVNIGASAIATELTIRLFGSQAIGIMTGILTLVILIFSEVTPKRIAIIHNQGIALFTALPIRFLSVALFPFIWIISIISSLITRFFASERRENVSMEGILHIVNVAGNMGVVKQYEQEMIKSIFRLNDVSAQAIMTHRTEVFSLEKNLTLTEAFPEMIEEGFSRIPVYDKDPEKIVGVVLFKDAAREIANGRGSMALQELMLEPMFIPTIKKISDIYTAFKGGKLNLAVVMDEYGGLAGIVTQEDVIEELFGELYDENEEKGRERIHHIKGNRYRIKGDTSLKQIEDSLGIELPHGKYVQTISGYIAELLDRLPQRNETVETEWGELTIEGIVRNRITSLQLVLKERSKSAGDENKHSSVV